MFRLAFTPEAVEDLRFLRSYDQRRILDSVQEQLQYQPGQETRNRKRLRPNELAEWELRIGTFRVFYNVDEAEDLVKVEAVGYKRGNVLFVHGEEYEL